MRYFSIVVKKTEEKTYDIAAWLIDLIDRDDYADLLAVFLDELYNLPRLWHNAIVRCHDENNNIRHLSAARAHRREGSVPWCIEKRDRLRAPSAR
jgi:hypothetical protein